MESCIRQVSQAFRLLSQHSRSPFLRLGQEPPPPPQEDSYDGRSLAEVCYHLIIIQRIIISTIFFWLSRLETCRQSRESTH